MAALRAGVGKHAVGAFLSQPHAGRLELALIGAVLLLKFCTGLQNVSFHPDESQWIATSYAFQAWIGGDFSARVWDDSYWTRTQPPVTRYLIAIGWLTGGYDIRDLNTPWIWGFDEATNLARGALPSPGLLWWSRLPMAVLAAVSALALFVLVTESTGRFAGYIFLILFAYNHFFLYALRRAMSEAPLLVCLTLTMLTGCSAVRSWQQVCGNARASLRPFTQPLLRFALMGLLSGIATAAKLNGALAVLFSIALVALLATRTRDFSRVLRVAVVGCSAIVIIASAAGVFVACNPYLYPNVPARSMAMFRQRLRGDGQAAGSFAVTSHPWYGRPCGDDLTPRVWGSGNRPLRLVLASQPALVSGRLGLFRGGGMALVTERRRIGRRRGHRLDDAHLCYTGSYDAAGLGPLFSAAGRLQHGVHRHRPFEASRARGEMAVDPFRTGHLGAGPGINLLSGADPTEGKIAHATCARGLRRVAAGECGPGRWPGPGSGR